MTAIPLQPTSPKRLRAPPLLASFRGYSGGFLAPDLMAGLTLAAIAVPEQMATARLGGLPPQVGFFAFVAASLAFAVFGVSRQVSAGADSTIAPIFASALAALALAGSPHYAALAAGLALMVGIVVAGAGVLRMGWIGNLLSTSVTLGFLAGIAVHIVVSQLPAALGVPAPSGSNLAKIGALIAEAPHANLVVLSMSGGVIAIVTICHLVSPRLPGALAAVVLAALAVPLLHLSSVGLLGHVASSPPSVGLPTLGARDILNLAPLAFMIALVVMVQTAATARSFPPPGGLPDEDGDFIGVGAANLLAGLVGAFAVNASPPRTAVVAESGGRTQAAGLTAAAILTALLMFGASLLAAIPEAALAGVLLFVAARIVRFGQIIQVAKATPIELILVLATAAGLVILPIQEGVALGIFLSLLYGLWAGARTRVRPMIRIPNSTVWWPATPSHEGAGMAGVAVVTFQAPLNFLNAEGFERDMLAIVEPGAPPIQLAVLESAGLLDIDFTAAASLKKVAEAYKAAGVAFAMARLESVAAQAAMARLGLNEVIGADRIFPSVAAAIEALGPKPA